MEKGYSALVAGTGLSPVNQAQPSATAVPTTAELLAQLANLLVSHGPDAVQVKDFIQAHAYDQEFAELAPLSVALKRALAIRADVPAY
jgi:hypothetical protein